jgi:Protein of unknown function DUF45
MRIHIEESKSLRRASACMRAAGEIQVKVPRHWPVAVKQQVTNELVARLERKDARERRLLENPAVLAQPRLTLTTREELEAFVRQVNAETFQLPLGKIAIGKARYHHLAQLNLSSKTMTVSAYCLDNVPMKALRYLIIHELAHYMESGHGPHFWKHVEKHVPDYRIQSRIMKAFHHQAVLRGSQSASGLAWEDSVETVTLEVETSPCQERLPLSM